MSTLSDIAQLEKERKVYPWKLFSPDPSYKYVRQLYLMEEVADKCGVDGFSESNRFKRDTLSNCRALLDDFVAGNQMDEKYDLKPLELPVWEFKIHPGGVKGKAIRILGWFGEMNTFIATHSELREDLRDFNSSEWRETMDKVHRKRTKICPHIPMLNRGTSLSNYIK